MLSCKHSQLSWFSLNFANADAAQSKPVANSSYKINGSVITTDYNVTVNLGTVNINRAPLTIKANDSYKWVTYADSDSYNGGQTGLASQVVGTAYAGVQFTGFVNGQDVSVFTASQADPTASLGSIGRAASELAGSYTLLKITRLLIKVVLMKSYLLIS